MDHGDWNYVGDEGLRHGGYFWREDSLGDHVRIVAVHPFRDIGGPDNLFRVEVGYLHVSDDDEIREKALAIVGSAPERATRAEIVEAFRAWGALDVDEEVVVRIGPADPLWTGRAAMPEPDYTLRAGTSLRGWVEREYLHAEPAPEPALA